jgi:hypothetical protein
MKKSRKIRWDGHVAGMKDIKNAWYALMGKRQEKRTLGTRGVDERIILR